MATEPKLLGMNPRAYMRFTCVGTAVCMACLGLGTASLRWLPYAAVWAVLYAFAAGCLLWMVRCPSSQRAGAFAGAATIVANVMRGGVITLGKLVGWAGVARFSWSEALLSAAVFWTIAFTFTLLFFTRVQFIASFERTRG